MFLLFWSLGGGSTGLSRAVLCLSSVLHSLLCRFVVCCVICSASLSVSVSVSLSLSLCSSFSAVCLCYFLASMMMLSLLLSLLLLLLFKHTHRGTRAHTQTQTHSQTETKLVAWQGCLSVVVVVLSLTDNAIFHCTFYPAFLFLLLRLLHPARGHVWFAANVFN